MERRIRIAVLIASINVCIRFLAVNVQTLADSDVHVHAQAGNASKTTMIVSLARLRKVCIQYTYGQL